MGWSSGPRVAWASLARYRRSRNRADDAVRRHHGNLRPSEARSTHRMRPIVIIPARMAATRLPGKPLADIGGAPMIVRVLRQAERAAVGEVAVAAGDVEIVEAVRAAGGRAVLTDPELPSGSDRVLAALGELDPDGALRRGGQPAGRHAVRRARHAHRLPRRAGGRGRLRHRHRRRAGGLASRPRRSGRRQGGGQPAGRRAARPGALFHPLGCSTARGRSGSTSASTPTAARRWSASAAAPPSPLEQREKLEQLRALELGLSIWAAVVDETPISVDTPADLEAARAFARTHGLETATMTKPKIAFQGEPGANSDEACRDLLSRLRAGALRGVRGRVRGGEVAAPARSA